MRTSSWIVVRLADNFPVLETWNARIVECLNTERYKAVPVMEYLQDLNRRTRESAPCKP